MRNVCKCWSNIPDMKKKFYFSDIVRRLETRLHCPVGMKGFRILLYGWRIKHRFPEYQFYGRKYMNGAEIVSFSEYAGYNLSEDTVN